MASAWSLAKGLVAVVTASAAGFGLCPHAAADPTTPYDPAGAPPNPTQQLPGLPALAQLSPIIQQAASNPAQATQLLMAAASAFTRNPTAPTEAKNLAASVNQFVQEPTNTNPGPPPDAVLVPHLPPADMAPGAQAHLPTGIDPAHAAGPATAAAPAPGTPATQPAPVAAPAAVTPAPTAAAPGFGPDAPPTQDFIYPSIGTNCLADGSSSIATALSVAGPAKIPLPGPGSGQTAYVFTAVGTPGPADVQKLPLNVTWVNLTTGKSGSATLKPRPDINPDGPTTLTVIADTGSGSIMSTIFGQVTTTEKQCQFMPTIGSTVVP
ncbi:Rv1157c family protein [Mycobacterium haemophilum]